MPAASFGLLRVGRHRRLRAAGLPVRYTPQHGAKRMLQELQRWYLAQCDGEWEHQYGVSIDSLDNPGWRLRIDLTGTNLDGRSFTPFEHRGSEYDWLHCAVEECVFVAHCGPLKLDALIGCFLEWAGSSTRDE